jgi:signal transduction histidine kinase
MLESTEKQTKRLSRLINDLLDVSIVSTGKLQLEKEEITLADIVADVIDRFKVQIQNTGSSVTTKLDTSVKGVWDKVRIEQVISNLFSNAIKYGNKKPISVTVKKLENTALFLIKDEGIGINPKKKKEIFERFKRGVSEKDYTGLGLGLYISKQIVEGHGGEIYFKTALGKGTTFIVELPL